MPKLMKSHEEILAQFASMDGGWDDLTDEEYREYVYPDGTVYRVMHPFFLKREKKDGLDKHRVMTTDMVHYIKPGWIVVRWKFLDPAVPMTF